MKNRLWILYGLLIGLLAAGAILLIAQPDEGFPIELAPAPSPTLTPHPTATPTPPPILIQVAGAVAAPGVYSLPPESRLSAAIDIAGGLAAGADKIRINLAARLQDGGYYYIPIEGEAFPETANNAPLATGSESVQEFPLPLNINNASQAALESLPGIGPTKAADIISYREHNGPFQSVEDLINVPGIGPTTLDTIRDFIIVQP
jgi:competence protein ComEA